MTSERARGWLRFAVGTALVTLAVAAPAGASTAQAVSAVRQFTGADAASFTRLEDAIDGGRVDVGALRPFLSAGPASRRWAAVYIGETWRAVPVTSGPCGPRWARGIPR